MTLSRRRRSERGRGVRRGEVWWGAPSLPGGSAKRRPFLVVSDDAFNRNDRYPKVLVVHLSSVLRGGDSFPWEVNLPRAAAGFPKASVVKCGEVYTLFKIELARLSGTLNHKTMAQVDAALAIALGLRFDR